MAIFYGQLEKAQLENLSAEPVGAPLGYIYHDTTSDCAKVKTSDGFKKLLGVSGSSKIITTSSAPNGATGLVAPIASLALVESDGTVFVKVGSGNLEWEQLQSDALALRTTGGTMTGDINLSGSSKIKSGSLAGYLFTGETTLTGLEAFSSPTQTYTPNSNAKALIIELLGPGGSYTHTHAAANSSISVSGAAGGGAYAKVLLKNLPSYSIQYTFNTAYTRLTLGSYSIQANAGSTFAVGATGYIGWPYLNTQVYVNRQVPGGNGGTVSSSGSAPADISVINQENGPAGSQSIFRFDNARYSSTNALDRYSLSFSNGIGGCNHRLGSPIYPYETWADVAPVSAIPGKIAGTTNELFAGAGQGAQPTGVITSAVTAGSVTIYSFGGPGRIRITELI